MSINVKNYYLNPLRNQIKDCIKLNSSVIEFGCGDGDLLIQLSNKISYGVGIDKSKKLIKRANYSSKKKNIQNIQFKRLDLLNEKIHFQKFDYAIASLLLHVLPRESSIKLIQEMYSVAERLIICSFTNPEKKIQRFLLELDQLFTSHRENYIEYKNKGGLGTLIQDAQIDFNSITYFPSFDESITVCIIT